MGIAALIIGILGFFLGWIPVVGTIVFKILAMVGVILGSIAVAKAEKQSAGVSIAGLVMCVVVLMGNSVRLW